MGGTITDPHRGYVMSPVSTATKDQTGVAVLPRPLPYPTADLLLPLSKEIVVDWQLPLDGERNN
ncbi:MAG TPA: hypothetical protein VNT52_07295 [Acidimicrobiales bacterium]|nr:hypothetical protein [Acidimicrobiales bacterium]